MKTNRKNRGYDMEELHVLRATNALRIEIEKERIRTMFSPAATAGNRADRIFYTATNFAEAAEYGIKTYRLFKKVSDLFRKKKK